VSIASTPNELSSLADERRASEALKDRELRELFAGRVAVLLAGFAALIAVLQLTGYRIGAALGFVRIGPGYVSISLNLAIVVLSVLFLRSHRAAFASPQRPVRWVRVSTHTYVSLVLLCMLGHVHLAGSQNTINVMLILFVALMVQRMLGARMGWIYFGAGTVAYVVASALEQAGVLAYAPLLQHGDRLGAMLLDPRYFWANLLIFVIVALVVLGSFQRFEEDRIAKQHELLEAELELERHRIEVQRLRSLVPMCASCKKIRDDAGFWQSVEEYIEDQTAHQVTHGICPECRKRLYPDITLGDTPVPGRGPRGGRR
jgi:hypothetical protein